MILAFIMGKDPLGDPGSTVLIDPLTVGAGGVALLVVGAAGVLLARKRRGSGRDPVSEPNSAYLLASGMGLVLLAGWMLLAR